MSKKKFLRATRTNRVLLWSVTLYWKRTSMAYLLRPRGFMTCIWDTCRWPNKKAVL